jgi:hypothetical protein
MPKVTQIIGKYRLNNYYSYRLHHPKAPTDASISEAMLVSTIPKASRFLSPQAKNRLKFPKSKW